MPTKLSKTASKAASNISEIPMISLPLFEGAPDGKSWSTYLRKADTKGPNPSESKQSVQTGLKKRPFNFNAVIAFKNTNSHHSTCIETKKESTVGLGLEQEETEKILNDLTRTSFQEVVADFAEDFWQIGNCHIEVIRRGPNGAISGLHPLPAAHVWRVIEDAKYTEHYFVQAPGEQGKNYAPFGTLNEFRARKIDGVTNATKEMEAEIITLRRPTSLDRFYGFPDWLAAVAAIELVQAIHQYNFDFFVNHGVPEFALFLLGATMDPQDYNKIKNALLGNVGLLNQRKSLVANIPNAEIKVQLEKLMTDKTNIEGSFGNMNDTLALEVVSAHRVPPILAGIQIPGKLGANNELPNAMMAFQALVIGPAQKLFTSCLDTTLGDPVQGVKGLKRGSFTFKKITDEIDVEKALAIAGTRTPVGAAKDGAPNKTAAPDSAATVKKMMELLDTPQVQEAMRAHFSALTKRLIQRSKRRAA